MTPPMATAAKSPIALARDDADLVRALSIDDVLQLTKFQHIDHAARDAQREKRTLSCAPPTARPGRQVTEVSDPGRRTAAKAGEHLQEIGGAGTNSEARA